MKMIKSSARAPFHVMVKPIGAQCNLRCDYCFYLEKTELYPGRKAADYRMHDETLKTLIRAQIESRTPGQNEVTFAWQGGEPTLMGIPFFERVVKLQRKYAPKGVVISNAFQTNGVLITDDFARFFHDHQFLLGVSIDGPEQLHDRFRVDTAGRGTFNAVMAGIERLNRHQVEYNLLTVVQSDNSQHPEQVYDFLTGLGSPFLQFIPIVEPAALTLVGSRSVSGEQWGEFLNRVFHRWRAKDIGRVYVQHFDMLLGLVLGYPASLCVHAPQCGRGLALEHNGDLFSCDHYVDREHFLGNITSKSVAEMVDSPFQRTFGEGKSMSLPDICKQCDYLGLCYGGCPKDRLVDTDTGKLNWLCAGYKAFYEETVPYFNAMAAALRQGLTASDYHRFRRAQ
ncbi:MAG: anaerobic sulfatase maturase [Propionivibrio sp.]